MRSVRFGLSSGSIRLALLAAAFALPQSAHAIIVADNGAQTDNPAANQVAPSGGRGWDNVGWRGFGTGESDGASAVYLGNRYVLTAWHAGPASPVTFGTNDPSGGTTYAVDGSFTPTRLSNPAPLGGLSDLLLYRIASDPGIAPIPLSSSSPTAGQAITMIGTGRNRGSVKQNSATVPPNGGFLWGPTRDKVWGTNNVNILTSALGDGAGGVNQSYIFAASFNDIVGDAIVTDKDSGSGAFVFDVVENRWELAGIATALYRTSATESPVGTAALDNHASGYIDISLYLSQFPADVPEPGTALLLPAVAGLLAMRRRARRAN